MGNRIIEGFWKCPSCGQRVKGLTETCPGCGTRKSKDIKYELGDTSKALSNEELKNVSKNPDWVCSFCGSLNSDKFDSCQGCGSTKVDSDGNYFEAKRKQEERRREKEQEIKSHQSTYEKSSIFENLNKSKLKSYLPMILGILGTVFLIGLLIFIFTPKESTITVSNISWETIVEIEQYKTIDESGWSLPATARLHYTQEEISGYKDVLDHYETKTRQVSHQEITGYDTVVTGYTDNGNGTFTEQTSQVPIYNTYYTTETYEEPVYRKEPIYDTKYYYEIDKWVYDRTVKTSEYDKTPYEGEYVLKDNERASATTNYYVYALNKKEKEIKYKLDYKNWIKIEKGQELKVLIDIFNNIEIIEFKDENIYK